MQTIPFFQFHKPLCWTISCLIFGRYLIEFFQWLIYHFFRYWCRKLCELCWYLELKTCRVHHEEQWKDKTNFIIETFSNISLKSIICQINVASPSLIHSWVFIICSKCRYSYIIKKLTSKIFYNQRPSFPKNDLLTQLNGKDCPNSMHDQPVMRNKILKGFSVSFLQEVGIWVPILRAMLNVQMVIWDKIVKDAIHSV